MVTDESALPNALVGYEGRLVNPGSKAFDAIVQQALQTGRGRPRSAASCQTYLLRSCKVEAIEIHDLVPRSDEITHKLLLGVDTPVDLGDRP